VLEFFCKKDWGWPVLEGGNTKNDAALANEKIAFLAKMRRPKGL